MGINTESPDEALTVVGNIKLTGHVFAPSDARVKTDVSEVRIQQVVFFSNWLKLLHQVTSFCVLLIYTSLFDNEEPDLLSIPTLAIIIIISCFFLYTTVFVCVYIFITSYCE